jgi:hypothetical protein
MPLNHRYHKSIRALLLAVCIHDVSSRIVATEKRSLLLLEDASRISRNEVKETKIQDYISIFGQQENAIIVYTDVFTQQEATDEQEVTNKTMIQSLYELIEDHSDLAPTTDDPTSIMLLRRESVNSFVDGRSEMNDSGPNARDVSNAFGNGPSSILNSFGA